MKRNIRTFALRGALAPLALSAFLVALVPVPVRADDETPVPLPCDPADCGPVPIVLPGCPTCAPGPAPQPGTAPGGPIE